MFFCSEKECALSYRFSQHEGGAAKGHLAPVSHLRDDLDDTETFVDRVFVVRAVDTGAVAADFVVASGEQRTERVMNNWQSEVGPCVGSSGTARG